MTNICPEHNIELTESGCPKCSEPLPATAAGNKQNGASASQNEKPEVPDDKEEFQVDINEVDVYSKNIIRADKSGFGAVTQVGSIGKYVQYMGKPEPEDGQHTISLFENSETTVLKDYEELRQSPKQVLEEFKRERILLLGDPGDKSSLRVLSQIARSIEINNKKENIRMLSLSKYKRYQVTVESLSFERESADDGVCDDALVIVNALNDGDSFKDSVVNHDGSMVYHYPSQLRDNKLYMICLLKDEAIYRLLEKSDKAFVPYWLIQDIKDKSSGEDKIKIKREAEELLNLDSVTDALIVRTVLFIGVFFPNLTTNEFNDLVDKFLASEPEVIIEKESANDSEMKATTKIPSREIWKSRSHFFSEKCFLRQTIDEQGRRINFQNDFFAQHIKERLTKNYWVFVDEKVFQVLEMRFIFHVSDNIADQSATILAEFLPGNEEKFIDWFLWVFNILNDEENRAENLKQLLGIADFDGSGGTEETSRQYFYYNRLAKLFRTILSNSSLKETVSNIMERLIQDSCFQSALMIVKKLQKADNFDEFHWLRQLLERGNSKTEQNIETYLFNNLANKSIDEVLNKLKDWLPKENKVIGNYSQANRTALLILVKYYSYQINILDEELYGSEPSQFPMFDFNDRASADESLELLVKYLLHPLNLRLRLNNMPYIFYAAFLIERWSRILCKDSPSSKTATSADETAVSNAEILNILLEKVLLFAGEDEQEIIKSFWKELMNSHDVIYESDIDWEIREQAMKEREFLFNLTEFFNDKQWALK